MFSFFDRNFPRSNIFINNTISQCMNQAQFKWFSREEVVEQVTIPYISAYNESNPKADSNAQIQLSKYFTGFYWQISLPIVAHLLFGPGLFWDQYIKQNRMCRTNTLRA